MSVGAVEGARIVASEAEACPHSFAKLKSRRGSLGEVFQGAASTASKNCLAQKEAMNRRQECSSGIRNENHLIPRVRSTKNNRSKKVTDSSNLRSLKRCLSEGYKPEAIGDAVARAHKKKGFVAEPNRGVLADATPEELREIQEIAGENTDEFEALETHFPSEQMQAPCKNDLAEPTPQPGAADADRHVNVEDELQRRGSGQFPGVLFGSRRRVDVEINRRPVSPEPGQQDMSDKRGEAAKQSSLETSGVAPPSLEGGDVSKASVAATRQRVPPTENSQSATDGAKTAPGNSQLRSVTASSASQVAKVDSSSTSDNDTPKYEELAVSIEPNGQYRGMRVSGVGDGLPTNLQEFVSDGAKVRVTGVGGLDAEPSAPFMHIKTNKLTVEFRFPSEEAFLSLLSGRAALSGRPAKGLSGAVDLDDPYNALLQKLGISFDAKEVKFILRCEDRRSPLSSEPEYSTINRNEKGTREVDSATKVFAGRYFKDDLSQVNNLNLIRAGVSGEDHRSRRIMEGQTHSSASRPSGVNESTYVPVGNADSVPYLLDGKAKELRPSTAGHERRKRDERENSGDTSPLGEDGTPQDGWDRAKRYTKTRNSPAKADRAGILLLDKSYPVRRSARGYESAWEVVDDQLASPRLARGSPPALHDLNERKIRPGKKNTSASKTEEELPFSDYKNGAEDSDTGKKRAVKSTTSLLSAGEPATDLNVHALNSPVTELPSRNNSFVSRVIAVRVSGSADEARDQAQGSHSDGEIIVRHQGRSWYSGAQTAPRWFVNGRNSDVKRRESLPKFSQQDEALVERISSSPQRLGSANLSDSEDDAEPRASLNFNRFRAGPATSRVTSPAASLEDSAEFPKNWGGRDTPPIGAGESGSQSDDELVPRREQDLSREGQASPLSMENLNLDVDGGKPDLDSERRESLADSSRKNTANELVVNVAAGVRSSASISKADPALALSRTEEGGPSNQVQQDETLAKRIFSSPLRLGSANPSDSEDGPELAASPKSSRFEADATNRVTASAASLDEYPEPQKNSGDRHTPPIVAGESRSRSDDKSVPQGEQNLSRERQASPRSIENQNLNVSGGNPYLGADHRSAASRTDASALPVERSLTQKDEAGDEGRRASSSESESLPGALNRNAVAESIRPTSRAVSANSSQRSSKVDLVRTRTSASPYPAGTAGAARHPVSAYLASGEGETNPNLDVENSARIRAGDSYSANGELRRSVGYVIEQIENYPMGMREEGSEDLITLALNKQRERCPIFTLLDSEQTVFTYREEIKAGRWLMPKHIPGLGLEKTRLDWEGRTKQAPMLVQSKSLSSATAVSAKHAEQGSI